MVRKQLRYISCRFLKKTMKKEDIQSPQEYQWKNHNMLDAVLNIGSDALFDLITFFCNGEIPVPMVIPLSKLMLMLSGDGALISLVPPQSHDTIREVCRIVISGEAVPLSLMQKMKGYCKELADLLHLSTDFQLQDLICDFAHFLVERVLDIHSQDHSPEPPTPIPGSYNPATGVAYYFTKEGCQLRKTPKYNIDCEAKDRAGNLENYDQLPKVDEPCRKMFPKVSFGGFGYMFIFFCPIHGHCYGCHLIEGGEGRKDPFHALFKYMEEPPTDVFYDFACQLSEYSLNREPGFFCCTRFWHDLFHGVTHKCTANFKSQRVCGLEGVNSEICEQWNAMLQCIKYTASHLSQAHMMFFTQFFMYLFNQDKTKRYEQLVKIAYQGTL